MSTGAGKLNVARLVRGIAALALLALYGEFLFVRFSILARAVASDACGQVLYPDITHLVLQIAVVAVAAPFLAFLTRKWPGVRLVVVAFGLSVLAVFLFAARWADVVMWSCDIGGGAIADYTIGLIGIFVLVWMGVVSVMDLRRGALGAAKLVDETVEN